MPEDFNNYGGPPRQKISWRNIAIGLFFVLVIAIACLVLIWK